MKLKALILFCCLGLLQTVFADNRHLHPKANDEKDNVSSMKRATMPDYCEIEIINNTYRNVIVSGQFEDGYSLAPFYIYRYDAPHTISLWYGYCQQGMYLNITDVYGYYLYSGYTSVASSVYLSSYYMNNMSQLKAEVKKK